MSGRSGTRDAGGGRRVPKRNGRSEGGYVLALTALALVPLVVVVAVAVDASAWQARAAALQRAADAAALAGAGALGGPERPVEVAQRVAAANGAVDGEGDVSVAVSVEGSARVAVGITDSRAPQVFSGAFLAAPTIARQAVAEVVHPVALGSPRNFLGTGSLAGTGDAHTGLPGVASDAAEDLWLTVNGPCSPAEDGDLLAAVASGNFVSLNPPVPPTPWRGCTPGDDPAITPWRWHDPSGYRLAVRVPGDHPGGPFTIQVYDAARCALSTPDLSVGPNVFTTTFAVVGPVVNPGAPGQAPVVATESFVAGQRCGTGPIMPAGYACGAGSWQQRWCNLATIADPEAGSVYLVTVATSGVAPGARHGHNGFALRARPGPGVATGDFVPCSVDPHDPAVAPGSGPCIQVHGVEWLSVLASGLGTRPSFALAEVGAEHGGATMEVSLFDPGEGTVGIQLVDPTGAAVGFSWQVDAAAGEVSPTGGTSGSVAPGGRLDTRGLVSGNTCGGGNPQPGPNRASSSKFNERLLRLTVELPDDLNEAWGGRRWWRIRYDTCEGRRVSDRATWGVRILGEPVRLVR